MCQMQQQRAIGSILSLNIQNERLQRCGKRLLLGFLNYNVKANIFYT